MQRLPELKPTPRRSRHPLIYGAGFLLLGSLAAFLAGFGMLFVVGAAAVAVVMAVIAFVIAVRGPRASA